jgi:hypothetical protein
MDRKPRIKPKPDDPEQSKRFIEAAREAEADETEEGAARAFNEAVRRPSSRPSPAPKAFRGKPSSGE